MDAVVNIDYNTEKINWILGDPEGWPEEMQHYFFRPVGEPFDWQYEQHACLVTPDGDIMCFDNGQFRSKDPAKRIKNKDNFSRGVRYRINTKDRTVQQIWQYGKELGDQFFSKFISNVEYYGEGHYMIHSGGIILRDGRAVDGRVQPGDPSVSEKSITVEVCGDRQMLQLVVRGNSYRAEKLPLYHSQDNLPLGPGIRLGSLAATKQCRFPQVCPQESGTLPREYEGSVEEEVDRFTFRGTFHLGQTVMLLLKNDGDYKAYNVATQRGPLNARKTGQFITEDACCVTCSISKTGLSGDYDLLVFTDGILYHTGIKISC